MAYLTSIANVVAVLLFLTTVQAIRDHRRRGGLPHPPGPRPLPIIGNLLDIPKQFSWLTYTKFAKTHGDIVSFRILGQVVVVLNSAKVAKDLFEKRAAIYSDRSPMTMYDMMGWDWVLTFARSGDRWRQGRRVLDRGLRSAAMSFYRPMLQAKTRVFLSRLLENPQLWEDHLDLLQGESILAMGYGYEVHGRDDRLLNAAKTRIKFAASRVLPGALLVNQIPLLRHIPDWLPWFSYKPLARIGRELGNETLYPPIRFVKESTLNGTALPSLALENLQELDDLKLSEADRNKAEETIAGALATMYSAGVDTSVGVMRSFFVAMLLYPDIQKKAREELDSVIGRDRLPTFEDRPRLPFVEAVYKEALRWRPITPVGVPHAVTQDDVYAGFFIPKGAVVIGNTWSILHDPALYPEPDIFKPERFLDLNGTLRDDHVLGLAFGFGKRICPGRHFADATLFILIASLLSTFNTERAGDDGDKLSDYSYSGGLLSYPNSFPCSFVPRDKKARELILTDVMAR